MSPHLPEGQTVQVLFAQRHQLQDHSISLPSAYNTSASDAFPKAISPLPKRSFPAGKNEINVAAIIQIEDVVVISPLYASLSRDLHYQNDLYLVRR
jgi:hypothetical protein